MGWGTNDESIRKRPQGGFQSPPAPREEKKEPSKQPAAPKRDGGWQNPLLDD